MIVDLDHNATTRPNRAMASVLACRPLFTPEFRGKRVKLLELLEEAGYEVPAEFLSG